MKFLPYWLRTVIGILLIVLAIITGPIPIVQGWIFFAAALAVLGTDHPISKWCFKQMERAREWVRPISKWCFKQIERGREWVRRWRGKKDPEPKV